MTESLAPPSPLLKPPEHNMPARITDRRSSLPRRTPLFILCVIMLSVGVLSGWWLRSSADAETRPPANPYAKLNTFAQVLSQIERTYVEDIEGTTLIYGAIKGMVRSLDPHSTFLTPEELSGLRDRTSGQYVGIGVEIGMRDDHVIVVAPVEGGPAERQGVRAGDLFVSVNGKPAYEWDVEEASKHLRGPKGSKVKVKLKHTDGEVFEIEIERQVVSLISVRQALLEPGYGYVSIASFTKHVSNDLHRAHTTLKAQNNGQPLSGLVLDLRNNPGGLLREAVLVTNAFLDDGLIVSTEGRRGFELARHEARSSRAYVEAPIVVLINAGSASASEIVAGALQDQKRAVIVGVQSFGKGSVQNIYDLEDGSGLKLTVARYFTPGHRSIQGLGITPDVIAEDITLPEVESTERIRESDLPGSLNRPDEGDDSEGDAPETSATPETKMIMVPLARVDAQRDLPLRTALDQLKAHRILSGKAR